MDNSTVSTPAYVGLRYMLYWEIEENIKTFFYFTDILSFLVAVFFFFRATIGILGFNVYLFYFICNTLSCISRIQFKLLNFDKFKCSTFRFLYIVSKAKPFLCPRPSNCIAYILFCFYFYDFYYFCYYYIICVPQMNASHKRAV